MNIVEYMGNMEAAVSDLRARIVALETAVTDCNQFTFHTDPSMPQVVIPNYEIQVQAVQTGTDANSTDTSTSTPTGTTA